MTDSMHSYVVSQLQAVKGRWPEVAREAGVPYRTVEKIGRGIVKDSRVSTLERLQRYFQQQEQRKAS